MSCVGECLDLGPPPDSILFLPPPPVPSILQHSLPDLLLNTTPCSAGQLCDAWVPLNKLPDSEDFVELSRKGKQKSFTGLSWLLLQKTAMTFQQYLLMFFIVFNCCITHIFSVKNYISLRWNLIFLEVDTWSSLDDTWLLVLIASSIGVLLLGALLAMFLLKCRE